MSGKVKAKWWWNVPIILLLGILIFLGIRSIVTDDNRYGWGTFSKQVVYRVEYYWVYDDGRVQRYIPGEELIGIASIRLQRRSNTRYSVGALKSWVNNYLKYLYENKSQNQVKSVKAEILYTINKNRKIKPTEKDKKLTIIYPVHKSSVN